MILVSNNRESTKLLEAFPLNLRRNKDVSEYKCTGKDNSLEGKKKKSSLDSSGTRACPMPAGSTQLH